MMLSRVMATDLSASPFRHAIPLHATPARGRRRSPSAACKLTAPALLHCTAGLWLHRCIGAAL